MWNAIAGGDRASAHHGSGGLVAEDGGLIGPFNAWLHSPAVGGPAAELGAAVRFRTTLDRRLLELAIVAVAAHWRASFEFWAHRRYAIEAGVAPTLVDAVADGDEDPPAPDDEALVLSVVRELLRTGRLAAATYEQAQRHLGDAELVELVTAVGYYTLVSFNLNAFEVAPPSSVEARWPLTDDAR